MSAARLETKSNMSPCGALLAAGMISMLASTGCASTIGRCPGSADAPARPMTSGTVVDPIHAVETVDAGFLHPDTLTVIVRYTGGSEPHRFTLHLRQPWTAQSPYEEGAMLVHEAPEESSNAQRMCRLDFDFTGERAQLWVVYADRQTAIPVSRGPRPRPRFTWR
jgi:hypothetical protein